MLIVFIHKLIENISFIAYCLMMRTFESELIQNNIGPKFKANDPFSRSFLVERMLAYDFKVNAQKVCIYLSDH